MENSQEQPPLSRLAFDLINQCLAYGNQSNSGLRLTSCKAGVYKYFAMRDKVYLTIDAEVLRRVRALVGSRNLSALVEMCLGGFMLQDEKDVLRAVLDYRENRKVKKKS